MNKLLLKFILALSTLASAAVYAASEDVALPPMRFDSSIERDQLFDLLKATPQFARLDKDLPGSPLMLIVTHSVRQSVGGKTTNFVTGFLSSSTLGIVPIIKSNNAVVIYDIKVHDKILSSFSYQSSITRVSDMWVEGRADSTRGLGSRGLEWLKSTVTDFVASAAHDPKLDQLKREYQIYFASAAAARTKSTNVGAALSTPLVESGQ